MAPFRTAQTPATIAVPPRRAPPVSIAFGISSELYRIAFREDDAVRVVSVDRRNGRLTSIAAILDSDRACIAAIANDGWAVYGRRAGNLMAWIDGDRRPVRLASGIGNERDSQIVPVSVDGSPCVVIASTSDPDARAVGPRVRVFNALLEREPTQGWFASASSRALLAATPTVFGPTAIFASDRDDEIDVCVAPHGRDPMNRTVSLGRSQRFTRAMGGGPRIVVVSRSSESLVVRTLASDLRSELNPVPIHPRTGWHIGTVHCAYASGPFVVAHAEHSGHESAAVVTVFDSGTTTATRVDLPTVDAVAVDGKDVVVTALSGGRSAPILIVHRMLLGGGRHRRYAYLLDQPRCDSSERRRALLADLADMLALSLGALAPRDFVARAFDPSCEVATFSLPGPDAEHDVSIALLVRHDESGAVSIRIGRALHRDATETSRSVDALAWVPAPTNGTDESPATRLVLSRVSASIESIVSAVGVLRTRR